MILTARRVGAEEGRDLGFVNEVVPHEELMDAARRWADQILECSPMSIRASKEAFYAAADAPDLETAIAGDYPAVHAMRASEDFHRRSPRVRREASARVEGPLRWPRQNRCAAGSRSSIGTGPGLSASLARRCSPRVCRSRSPRRDTEKLAGLCADSGARAYGCDATVREEVDALFASVEADLGIPHFVVYNPSARAHGPITEIDPGDVERALAISLYGGFLVGQAAAKRLLPSRDGAIFFTGATASVKGYPHSAAFAMGKFGLRLRGLAQSMARELAPQGVHVAHFVIDGGIRSDARGRIDPGDDHLLDPDAIADTYWHVYRQHRSSWAWEVEVRPWVEKF